MSNSFEHAFHSLDKRIIQISIEVSSLGDINQILYSDGGNITDHRQKGFGTVIINTMAVQYVKELKIKPSIIRKRASSLKKSYFLTKTCTSDDPKKIIDNI